MAVEDRIEREARPLRFTVGEEEEEEATPSVAAAAASTAATSEPPPAALPVPLRRIAASGSISSRSRERVESGGVFLESVQRVVLGGLKVIAVADDAEKGKKVNRKKYQPPSENGRSSDGALLRIIASGFPRRAFEAVSARRYP